MRSQLNATEVSSNNELVNSTFVPMAKIKVYAPGSIGNVGSGFDVFGLAIQAVGDTVEVEENSSNELRILEIDGDKNISTDPAKNIVTVGAKALLASLGSNQGFNFRIKKEVVAGSGLGSSGSSATAGVFAINEIFGNPLTKNELIPFAAIGEQLASHQVHYGNVAPSMLGGFTVIRSTNPLEILQVNVPDNLYFAIARPDVVIKTEEAKKILGKTMDISSAVTQFGNVAGLIVGLYEGDISLIGRSVEDRLATPVRSKLIPKYDLARINALEAGALGFNISGSGSAMFAVCDSKIKAEHVLESLKSIYTGLSDNFYITKADTEGTRVII